MTAEKQRAGYEQLNRAFWDADADAYQAQHASDLDRAEAWGAWRNPETELGVLDLDRIAGRDVLEFGCGAAQWSSALSSIGEVRSAGSYLACWAGSTLPQLTPTRIAQSLSAATFTR